MEMEFLYFLLVVIAIILFFRIFFRYVFPWILARWLKKKQKEFFDMYGRQGREREEKKEGEVNIDYVPEEESSKDTSMGEYVDFEEIGDEEDENDDKEKKQ